MTDRRRELEEALAESQERLTQLSEAMFDAVAIHDGGTILEVNDTCLQLFGYPREELVGREALDLAAPQWREAISKHLDSGAREPLRALGRRRDGSTFWGELRFRVVPYRGRQVGMVILRDIGERREAEVEQQRRLAQERVHRAVLEMEHVEDFGRVVEVIAEVLEEMGVPYQAVGLNTLDEDAGTLTAYAMMSGRLSVQSVNDLSHPVNQELLRYWHQDRVWERPLDAKLDELLRRYREDSGAPYNPSVIIDVPFEEGTLVVGLQTQPGENDEIISLLRRFCPLVSLGYARTQDMAERGRAEVALRQAHDELEERVRERTSELSAAVQALQREIAVRHNAEARLKASLHEKELLLKEVHHRVKNNLQVISSLLSLQSGHVADEQVLSHIEDTRHRVMSMALIHESLYESGDLERIDMADYVTTLTRRLFDSYRVSASRIALNLDTEAVELGIETAIPCGLILNELVSNALQHGFPEERTGAVDIVLRRDAGGAPVLQVRDDGVGLPAGVDAHDSPSLGLTLVRTLAHQVHARFQVDTRSGTCFTLHLPVAKAPRRD